MQSTRATPASRQSSTARSRVSPDASVQPTVRTMPSRMSRATTSLSPSCSAHGPGIGERSRADDDPVGACVEQGEGVLERADPAGGLQARGGRGAGDPAYELGPRTAAASAVEVDEVDPTRPLRRESPRERNRVARALDDLVVVTLVEAHRALAEDIHGRYHFDRGREPARQEPIR